MAFKLTNIPYPPKSPLKVDLSSAKEALSSKVSEATASVKDKFKTTADKVTEKVSNVKNKADQKVSQIKQKATNVIQKKGKQIGTKLDSVQTALTGAGIAPGVGIGPDLLNTAISGGRTIGAKLMGDKAGVKKHAINTGLNALSAIPGPGDALGATMLAKDIATNTKETKNNTTNRKYAYGK